MADVSHSPNRAVALALAIRDMADAAVAFDVAGQNAAEERLIHLFQHDGIPIPDTPMDATIQAQYMFADVGANALPPRVVIGSQACVWFTHDGLENEPMPCDFVPVEVGLAAGVRTGTEIAAAVATALNTWPLTPNTALGAFVTASNVGPTLTVVGVSVILEDLAQI